MATEIPPVTLTGCTREIRCRIRAEDYALLEQFFLPLYGAIPSFVPHLISSYVRHARHHYALSRGIYLTPLQWEQLLLADLQRITFGTPPIPPSRGDGSHDPSPACAIPPGTEIESSKET